MRVGVGPVSDCVAVVDKVPELETVSVRAGLTVAVRVGL